MSGQRRQWMDSLRGLAVLLVLMGHTAGLPVLYLGREDMQWIVNITGALEPYRLPLLFILSGLLVPRSVRKPLGTFWWGKVRHIAWPYLVWMLVLWQTPGMEVLLVEWRFWVGDWGNYLWYLVVLFSCYLAAPLVSRLRIPWWAAALLCWLGLFVGQPEIELLQRHLWWGGFFFLGAGLAEVVPTWQRVDWRAPLCFAVAAAAWGVVVAVSEVPAAQTVPSALASVVGVLVLLWLAPRLEGWSVMTLLASVGRRSIVVYVAHYPAAYVLMISVNSMELGALATFVVLTALTLVCVGMLMLIQPLAPFLFELPALRRAGAEPAVADSTSPVPGEPAPFARPEPDASGASSATDDGGGPTGSSELRSSAAGSYVNPTASTRSPRR